MIWVYARGLLFCIVLAYGAYEDIKTREIPDIIPAIIMITGIQGESALFAVSGLCAAGLPFLIAAVIGDGIGGGDIKLMAACGFALGPFGGVLQTVVGLTLALLFVWVRALIKGINIKGKEKIPLVPFLGAGGIFSYLITYIGGLT